MSWGYWGIVLGVAMLLIAFFVSFEIMLWRPKISATDEQSRAVAGEAPSNTKHAA
jgi:hypothetical protein